MLTYDARGRRIVKAISGTGSWELVPSKRERDELKFSRPPFS